MRGLIHAGFHKTGTTPVQARLPRNRARPAPHLRFFLPGDIRAALVRPAPARTARAAIHEKDFA
ncbi:MAG: hypothetical protein CML65_16575 [Rhodobacteraceae bacterium]|nr:hypothetical protein [Paracoccaceae bacterium]|tara:strand:- start:515 stop:706 length:192 start_codon:yes stop_codon:yes gene_type:complete